MLRKPISTVFIALAMLCPALSMHAQNDNEAFDKITQFPSGLFDQADKKTVSLERQK